MSCEMASRLPATAAASTATTADAATSASEDWLITHERHTEHRDTTESHPGLFHDEGSSAPQREFDLTVRRRAAIGQFRPIVMKVTGPVELLARLNYWPGCGGRRTTRTDESSRRSFPSS